jgi:hypothetical protein
MHFWQQVLQRLAPVLLGLPAHCAVEKQALLRAMQQCPDDAPIKKTDEELMLNLQTLVTHAVRIQRAVRTHLLAFRRKRAKTEKGLAKIGKTSDKHGMSKKAGGWEGDADATMGSQAPRRTEDMLLRETSTLEQVPCMSIFSVPRPIRCLA